MKHPPRHFFVFSFRSLFLLFLFFLFSVFFSQAAISGYTLRYSTGGGSYTTASSTISASTLSYTITGLAASTSYAVSVSASSVAGASAFSPDATLSTIAFAACLNGCTNAAQGTCVQSQCRCAHGFVGADCSMATSFSQCTPTNSMCMLWTYDATNIYVQVEAYTAAVTGWSAQRACMHTHRQKARKTTLQVQSCRAHA